MRPSPWWFVLALAACAGPTDPTDDPSATDTGGTDTDVTADTAAEAPAVFATLVRGELFTADLAEAQAAHDGLASYGQAAAQAAGDLSHDALLGTTLLGSTTARSFLGLDQWDDADAMSTFYQDPAFAEAFGALFSAPPTVEAFARRDDWHGWGSLEAGDGAEPHFFAVVRGRLAEPDPAAAQAAHDAIASYGEPAVTAVGDVAHVVFVGLADPQEFLAIDVWTDDAAIEAIYTDPEFAAAFATLFSAPPTLQVYASTGWHQW